MEFIEPLIHAVTAWSYVDLNADTIMFAVLIFWNIIVFAVYGMDKFKARYKKWRISENTLITLAFLFGGVGALGGMLFFKHKTRHTKFKILVPLAIAVNAAVVGILFTVTSWL